MSLHAIFRSSDYSKVLLCLITYQTFKLLGCSTMTYLPLGFAIYTLYHMFASKKVEGGDKWDVIVVGAGMSGLNVAKELKESGINFVVFEKASQPGGTWWFNTYPGVACDVPSHLYSLSSYLNPWWTKAYSKGNEIEKYLLDFAQEFKILDKIKFNVHIKKAEWNESKQNWTVTEESGTNHTANAIVSAVGALHQPLRPNFKNQDKFQGKIIHSAEWPSKTDVKGKKVAIIGTGASAVQIAPNIGADVETLHVFQRTPCWVPPRQDYYFSENMKIAFSWFPPLMLCLRWYNFLRNEFRFQMVFHSTRQVLANFAQKLIVKEMRKMIQDQALEDKLIPKFPMGCKRVTPSDTYLQTFKRPNVSLITDPIECFTEKGIKTKSGQEFAFDVVILATGFSVMASTNAYKIVGKGGKELQEEWGDEPRLFKGTSYPNYPNLFFILGPGTGLGHSSIVFVIESQTTYVMDCLRKLIKSGYKSMDLKQEAVEKYLAMTRNMMKNKVFRGGALGGGCFAWYTNERGVNWTLWPGDLIHFWWMTRKCTFGDYYDWRNN